MVERTSIIRLDGHDGEGGVSILLLSWLDGKLEVVVTEQHGADAVVVLAREQANELTQALAAALGR